jgi:1-acyl-sn-glycerol-3-phosphate acyltransferase
VTLAARLVNATIRRLTGIVCRVDESQLARVPAQGPLIIYGNHINFLDVPLVFTRLLPRPMTGFAKIETWDSPFLGPLFSMWGAIPIRRGEPDRTALHSALAVLDAGQIIGMSPEGTRSGDGRLQCGYPGVVLLALRSGAPLLPVAHYGGENFKRNLRRLRRTDFSIVVGQPFYLDAHGVRVTQEVRRQMTDELMYQLAALMPPAYQGVYSDLAAATTTWLRFPEG